ncbi:peroxisomal copper amine oxidase [Coniophora puteana RWD-64-598 SS2]|uniref:Amine oxidase n=1 Tax=Coniophora puteana (strain RWD-64-598) TaxID=741705 RepID=A0A5M3N779_CONPW|nr:peroxisomal copper amine oxidase [Coniophora puteana RWD-64-598 SS2]EIW87176.1 peroxisomal copper amine oxidase [Coniophora puteana RWD-64-598 SS2]
MSPTPTLPGTASAVVQDKAPIKVPTTFKHPLDPLTPEEIQAVTLAVRHHIAAKTQINAVRFITCSLCPPPKRAVLATLGIPLFPGGQPEAVTPIPRKAEVDFIDVVNGPAYNTVLSLENGIWSVDTLEPIPKGSEPQITPEELIAAETIVRKDPRVQELCKQVGIRPDQLCADGWAIGYDARFPEHLRLQQALLFARLDEHENLYAHPLDFVPVIDSVQEKVIQIDFPPIYKKKPDGSIGLSVADTTPGALSNDDLALSGRERIPPPLKRYDFLPDLRANDPECPKPREDVKPLHIVQPEGVSFKMNGHELEWQKWKMHIGEMAFSHREGVAISTITYNDDGVVRPIFYRLSVAEMVVPYAAPEFPHPRKFAFDTGEYGQGTMANDLSLGCDCLGNIHYLPGAFVNHNGSAFVIDKAVCIHEEDAGLLWKHTDYRPGGRAQTVRRRRLVVSMVTTLANYEYIWNYMFYQDGNVELEIRMSGILQVYVASPDEPNPHGTTIAPNINAQHHQHIFSLRVDPMLDGLYNSVVESDIVALPQPTGSAENFYGNAFAVRDTVLRAQAEGARDFDWARERRWRIVNPATRHYASGREAGYSVAMKSGLTPVLAKEDSFVQRRATFTQKPVWVVRDEEGPNGGGGRMWPSGKYVPQTKGEPVDSVATWVKEGGGSIEKEDIVMFLTVGMTHIARPEDWPVMPVEHVNVTFRPNNFFKMNPSMDVPGVKDTHSKLAFGGGSENGTNGTNGNGSNGAACCNH